MSKYAVQALLTAAAEDASVKERLADASQMEAAVSELLSLTEEEKAQVSLTVVQEDSAEGVNMEANERNNPGPGSVGGGRLF